MDQRRLSACANFVGYTDAMGHINQPNMEQRRLSDGPYTLPLRLPHNQLHYPDEFSEGESYMSKRKNSSLTILLDSTSLMMRTASSTFHCLIGSARRASYCGAPDPSIQLSPNGNSGSLYLLPTTANSNESSLSNASYDDQRRTVTIYDGRVPATPTTPNIPFELMTPFDAITQAIDDPVESFVQIVLEEPDERPPVIRPLSSSRRNSASRHRHRSNSPSSTLINGLMISSEQKFDETQSMPITGLFNSLEIHYQPPADIEPMDFSFLEAVLRGESAAPPSRIRSSSLCHKLQQISVQSRSASEDLAIDLRSPPHTITIVEDDLTSTDLSSSNNTDYSLINQTISSSRLKVPSSID